MRENEIFKNLRDVLLNSLDIPEVEVKRSFQPTQQGGDFNPTIYMHLVSQRRYGYLERSEIPSDTLMRHIERQYYESTIQFTGYVMEDANTDITSVDLLNLAAEILQSDSGREYLRSKQMSIIRLTDIRHLYITDEQDRFQSSPSFDFVVITQQIKETTSPIIRTVEFNKYEV